MKVKYQEFKVLEVGQYYATLKSIEEISSKFGPSLKWTFSVSADGSETDNVDVTALYSKYLTSKTKLYGWITAFGVDPRAVIDVELDTLIGKRCMVDIINKTQIVDGRETVFNNIAAVYSASRV